MKAKRALALVPVLALALAGCGGSSGGGNAGGGGATDADCAKAEVLCVGLVTDTGKVDDKSFNQSAWEGVQAAVKELGGVSKYVETTDTKDYGNNIKLEPGLYTVELTIQSPADDFMLHTGKDTSGVQGRFWNEPLKVVFDNFEWDGQLL